MPIVFERTQLAISATVLVIVEVTIVNSTLSNQSATSENLIECVPQCD